MTQYPDSFWLKTFKMWKKSGQSQAEFCRTHDLCRSTFYNKMKSLAPFYPPANELTLVELSPSTVAEAFASHASGIHLHIAGIDIEVDEGFSRDTLRSVLEVLHA